MYLTLNRALKGKTYRTTVAYMMNSVSGGTVRSDVGEGSSGCSDLNPWATGRGKGEQNPEPTAMKPRFKL